MFNDVDKMIYFTDNRQMTHFKQVFRACKMSGISPEGQELVHMPFGTINGSDGKPFKTRSGDTIKLQDIINLVTDKAKEKLAQNGIVGNDKLAKQIGICAMKFGDLSNFVSKDYIFDLDKFTSFEGKTGPYIQYTAVRIKSVLNKADYKQTGEIVVSLPEEKKIIVQILKAIDSLEIAYNENSLNSICMALYDLCAAYSNFYNNVRILTESDIIKKQSYLNLSGLTLKVITILTDVLAIEIPEKM
jgi:arginyl-tRNA synthetase